MKTAIQQIIDKLEKDYFDAHYEMTKSAIRQCIFYAEDLLETEKQQIIEAYYHGQNMNDGEKYYTSTFEINKETLK